MTPSLLAALLSTHREKARVCLCVSVCAFVFVCLKEKRERKKARFLSLLPVSLLSFFLSSLCVCVCRQSAARVWSALLTLLRSQADCGKTAALVLLLLLLSSSFLFPFLLFLLSISISSLSPSPLSFLSLFLSLSLTRYRPSLCVAPRSCLLPFSSSSPRRSASNSPSPLVHCLIAQSRPHLCIYLLLLS